ncbi:MAG TPA: DUF72 domain-containing protein [Candidatus Sulfotelmatobacter sp.]|jgi:uncharacterized protein YecE (DUF72 family)|nr:DUF72 domain-containing protein [Candidatus Sulfotelmatobacter sp.]
MRPKKDSTQSPAAQGRLRIGPAGWSYPDWSGFVYPSRRAKNFHEATFLAQFFDTIEINTSFYQPIRPDHANAWIERVSANPSFLFTAKLWQRFTHEPSATAEDERSVRAGFDVLREAGKLGAVLLQFPFSFHKSPESSDHLSALLKRFADYPLVVELRHSSWQAQATLDLLREHNAGFCNIDQPVIGNSVTPSSQSTSPLGYVRFHGRRYDTWFSDDPKLPAHERYNYLYSLDELQPWVTRIQEVQQHTRDTYVVTNNHYQGKAVVNALQLLSILKGTKRKVPDELRQHYPQLEQIASEMPAAPTLFPLGSPVGKKSQGSTS